MRRRIDGVEASSSEPTFSGILRQRSGAPFSPLSKTQAQTEALVSQFVQEAADPVMLASLCAGGVAYRVGKIGALASSVGALGQSPARVASIVVGLGSEITAYELTNRILHTITGVRLSRTPLQDVSRFPSSVSPLWSWSGPGGWREGLTSSALNFGALKVAGFVAREENLIFQQALQSASMVTGHNVSGILGITLRPEGNLAEQFLHAEVMNLQMHAGMGLVHSLAPGVHAMESRLDLSLRNVGAGTLPPSSECTRSRAGGSPPLPWETQLRAQEAAPLPTDPGRIFFMSSFKEDGSGKKTEDLAERYRPLFPPETHLTFSERVIQTTLQTSLEDPLLKERLLESYAQAPNRGTLEQLYTVSAIKDLFSFDAIRTSAGSFDNTLLQTLLTRILSEDSGERRQERMNTLFQTMEEDRLSRHTMSELFKEWGYGKEFRPQVFPRTSFGFWKAHRSGFTETLKGYGFLDKAQIFNFVFAETGGHPEKSTKFLKIFQKTRDSGHISLPALEQALKYARQNPLGRLVLKRLFLILALEDAPAKVSELRPERQGGNSLWFIAELARQGKSLETIAQTINSTRHNAYFDDLRLARKLVGISLEIHPHVVGRAEERKEAKAKLLTAMDHFLFSGKALNATELIRLLQTNDEGELNEFHRQWGERQFDFEVVSGPLFDHVIRGLKQIPDCQESVFIPRKDETAIRFMQSKSPPHEQKKLRQEYQAFLKRLSERDQIMIREMPRRHAQTIKDIEEGRRNLRFRLWGLIHEWGHFLHHSGTDDAIRQGEEPLSLANISRENRLKTEIWAFLQEQPWRVKNIDIDPWIVGLRLGENFPLYLRHLNDQSYFGEVNERLLKELDRIQ